MMLPMRPMQRRVLTMLLTSLRRSERRRRRRTHETWGRLTLLVLLFWVLHSCGHRV
jgi:uncharacterized iron-regulated membrane protein